jgi:hypothetical protein
MEEHRRMGFESRVLRRIFGPKRDEVTGEWRRLQKEELYDLYSNKYNSGDQVKKNEMGGACGTNGRRERCVQGFDGETLFKRPLGRPRLSREDNIKMDLQDVG